MKGPEPFAELRGARIALLIESDGPGGPERMVAQLAGALQEHGLHPVVFAPAQGEGWLARELAPSGTPIEHVPLDGPIRPRVAADLAEAFRRHRISLAHSHEFLMAVYGAWAARRAGIPHVITMHGARYYADRLRRRVALRTAITLSGATTVVSQALSRDLAHDLWTRHSVLSVIPNGVRFVPRRYSTLRRELGLGPDARLVVAVGNLYPVKGHRHLIEAHARLARHHPDLHVAIAGRGELDAELLALAAARGIGDRVHLLGLRSDIPNVLAGADVFALPSLAEGLPLALLEAMFAELPIVASDVGEVRTALAGGRAGLLVPPGEPAVLADALDRLLAAPPEARDLAGRAAWRAVREYSLDAMAARYLAVYARLLGADRGADVMPRMPRATRPMMLGRLASPASGSAG
jgi:glycosyltransferase involved in cell wall biosynthesis